MKFTEYKKIFEYIGKDSLVYLIEQKGKRVTDTHKLLKEKIKSSTNTIYIEINTALNEYTKFYSIGKERGNTILITKDNLTPILDSLGFDLDFLIEKGVILIKHKEDIENQRDKKKNLIKYQKERKFKGITTNIANVNNKKLSDELCIWFSKTKDKLDKKSTKSENKMEYILTKRLPLPFKKNHPFMIKNKKYFADFYIKSANAIIEVDGGYHDTDEQREKDRIRDKDFSHIGIKTYRIKNEDIRNNSKEVIDMIKSIILRKKSKKKKTSKNLSQ